MVKTSHSLFALALVMLTQVGADASAGASASSDPCAAVRDRLIRQAQLGGGRTLERYCDDCARGGGPGYRVVRKPGQGVMGRSAAEIAEMSCEEVHELASFAEEADRAIETAREADLARQAEEQRADMTGRRDWARQPTDDPEGDYWRMTGEDDPYDMSFAQFLDDLDVAFRTAFGVGEGGAPEALPDVDARPLVRPVRTGVPMLDVARAMVQVVGEVAIARDQRALPRLRAAQDNLENQIGELDKEIQRFEDFIGSGIPGASEETLRRAVEDAGVRAGVLKEQLEAIRSTREDAEARLKRYHEHVIVLPDPTDRSI